MKNDSYITELERQDIALRERIEQLCREKEKLEASIENKNEMIRGCFHVKVMNFYHITLCFPTKQKGVFDNCIFRVSNRSELLDFFMEDGSYDLICNGRETPIIKITRPLVRKVATARQTALNGEKTYYSSYISLYATRNLPSSPSDSNIQICLTSYGEKKVLYKADGGYARKSMPELIEMVKGYLKDKEGLNKINGISNGI